MQDQAACGSCASFAAYTALAGTIDARKTGDGSNFTKLSFQHGLDCTRSTISNETLWGKNYNNRGCQGGTASAYWEFTKDQGVAAFDNYPGGYESKDGLNFDCRDAQVTGTRTFVASYDA